MKNKKKIKAVGENIMAGEASWNFGGDVPEAFSGHIRKSVPFYDIGHDLVCKISDFFVKDGSLCYELGVSTGILFNKLIERHKHRPHVQWVGIDREVNMIARAKKTIPKRTNVKLVVDDICTYDYQKSDLVVSYYTMQFIPPHVRQEMFNRIYNCLNWGGAFILFEKVRASDARFQDIMQLLYTDFKLEQDYSPDEIIAKARSLKGVMEPFSTQGNLDLFKRAGFVDVMSVFKYVCFEGFLAIK